MKSITVEEITAAVRQLCMDVSYDLPADVEWKSYFTTYTLQGGVSWIVNLQFLWSLHCIWLS